MNPTARITWRKRNAGFTLIELILVMSLLMIVLSVSAPSLSRFFRGRSLDAEARRFLALTHYGQSRAVAEGAPMILWLDVQQGRYGMQTESSYAEDDRYSVKFNLDQEIRMEVPILSKLTVGRPKQPLPGVASTIPYIRFTPDGYIDEGSPNQVWFRERQHEDSIVAVGQAETFLHYEIQTNLVTYVRR
jgi:type II secretion system protein H